MTGTQEHIIAYEKQCGEWGKHAIWCESSSVAVDLFAKAHPEIPTFTVSPGRTVPTQSAPLT